MVTTFDAQLTVDGGLLIFVVGQLKVRCSRVISSYTLANYVVGVKPQLSKPLANIKVKEKL